MSFLNLLNAHTVLYFLFFQVKKTPMHLRALISVCRESGRQSDIEMRIQGHSLDGLLFWISSSFPIREEGDFLTVGFQKGLLLFHYNLGCGRAYISYNKTRVSDGKWYTIKAQR